LLLRRATTTPRRSWSALSRGHYPELSDRGDRFLYVIGARPANCSAWMRGLPKGELAAQVVGDSTLYAIFLLMSRLLKRVSRRLKRWYMFQVIASSVSRKTGLEIGGPSRDFSKEGLIPIYSRVGTLHTCNYLRANIWSNEAFDYIHEASRLESIADATYDFLLASHILEHVANPVKALKEWHRVLRPGGSLLVLLPNKEHTFDHRRPYTSLDHLIADFEADTREDDLTHLEEILRFHDLEMDPPAGTPEAFRERSLKNFENRALHHHVFDPKTVPDLFSFAGFRLTLESIDFQPHIIAFGRRPA
jgi:SAM-dependent methyltransferase